MKSHILAEVDWPEFGLSEMPSGPSLDELENRINNARAAMEKRGLSHLVVYADREHFANLTYLTGFDPRFEESVLIIRPEGTPLILVGNECEGYLPVSPLHLSGKLRHECYQTLSPLDQPRSNSRLLKTIFLDEGIDEKSLIGCVGWKYLSDVEQPNAKFAIDLPSFIVDTLREISGWDRVINVTDIFMHADYGLRTFCTPSEIAYFEYANILASEGMKRMIMNMNEGMTDFEVMAQAQINGVPLGCHPTFATGERWNLGLAGPSGEKIIRGNPLSTNLCYWGSNCCRAGWIAESSEDLPEMAKDYIENFAGKYFEVMAEWLRILKIGTPGGEFFSLVHENMPYDKYGILLNPGHLIHLDEWLSAPMYKDSTIPIHSGMMIQVDVIPFSPTYFSSRMEDSVVIADGSLQKALKSEYPQCFKRCMKRREFMATTLKLELPDEVLPLSNIAGIVPPYFLNPQQIFALEA